MPDGSLASRGRLNEPWGIAVDAGAIYFAEDVPGAEQGAIRRVGLDDGRVSTLRTDIATDSAIVGMLGNTLVVNESLADPVRIDVTTGERRSLEWRPDSAEIRGPENGDALGAHVVTLAACREVGCGPSRRRDSPARSSGP